MGHDLRRQTHPGKFEGGLIIDEHVYTLSLDGCDEEAGDVQEHGEWYGLLRGPIGKPGRAIDGLTRDEDSFLSSRAGAIVSEDSQGFTSVEYYADAADLDRRWSLISGAFDSSDSDA